MTRRVLGGVLLGLGGAGSAWAQIAPECQDYVIPRDYDEQAQQDFLANWVGLATTFSPLHDAVPHEPGRGSLGVDLALIPPLSCARRVVLDGTKTEDTNGLPLAPRLTASFAFPALGPVVLYAGVGYAPPVTVANLRSVIVSAELGLGLEVPAVEGLEVGARFHATQTKVVAEIATPFSPTEPTALDLQHSSTFGADLLVSYDLGVVSPYVAGGILDNSTFFFIGDNGAVPANLHPYLGPAFSVGVDGLVADRFRFGAELYTAPGGYHRLEETPRGGEGNNYGSIVTGRARLALEF